MFKRYLSPAICLALATSLGAFSATAAETTPYVLTLAQHAFSPQPLVLPANQKVTVVVKNAGDAPAEFESSDLGREKVVQAHSEIKVKLGPLDAGTYKYVDDFHRETTGTIVVK